MRSTVRTPAPRSTHPLVRVVRGVWTLPSNVVGHAIGRFVAAGEHTRFESKVAVATLYPIRWRRLHWIGAVTLGHAILYRPEILDGTLGQWILAHELAHTRQHDVLGPLYLPLHVAAQAISAVLFVLRPRADDDRWHAYNPLEQTWLALGAGAYRAAARGQVMTPTQRDELLKAWGVVPHR